MADRDKNKPQKPGERDHETVDYSFNVTITVEPAHRDDGRVESLIDAAFERLYSAIQQTMRR